MNSVCHLVSCYCLSQTVIELNVPINVQWNLLPVKSAFMKPCQVPLYTHFIMKLCYVRCYKDEMNLDSMFKGMMYLEFILELCMLQRGVIVPEVEANIFHVPLFEF